MLMYPIWLNLIGKNHRLNVKLVTAEQLLPRASPDFWAGLDRDLGRAEVIRPWGGGAPQLLSTEKVQKCSLTHLWAHSEKTVALQVLEIRHPAYNKAHRVHPSPHLGLKLEYLLISTQIRDANGAWAACLLSTPLPYSHSFLPWPQLLSASKCSSARCV